MTTKEMWNLIVKDYKENYNQPEKIVQALWENYFSEIFGYKKVLKEIDAQRSIHIGSGERTIPDIIIRKNEQALFDVELKQYHLPFVDTMERQLKSYMDLLHVSVGVLVCEKLYIYVYDYNNAKMKRFAIEFVENNADGESFIELFLSSSFSKNKVEEFIDSKNNEVNAIQEIQSILNADFLLDVMKDYLSASYDKEVVDKALADFEIKVEKKQKFSTVQYATVVSSQKKVEKTVLDNIVDNFDCFVETDDTPDFIIIKTTEKRLLEVKHDFYYAVRYCWVAKLKKAQSFKYVLGVLNGRVEAVYEVDYWQQSDQEGRIEFFGHDAPNEIASQFLHKKIPARFRKKGLASPFLYSTMGK